jgi:hypothetical protein
VIGVAASAEPDAVAEAATDGHVATGGEVTADGQPKRKRSRRGARGGRKRRKPSANGDQIELNTAEERVGIGLDGADPDSDGEPAAVAESVVDETVPEYVPMSEWIGDFDSRSRRS